MMSLNALPQVEATFVADNKSGTFTKTCRFHVRDFPKLDLDTPLSSAQQDNPYREYYALKKLQLLLEHNVSDGVPKLLSWKVAPGLTTLTMELAVKGPLADYFSVRDPEDPNNYILHHSIPGPMEQKLSLLIRCLVTLYLFAMMDIKNNDLHVYNVVIGTCDYDYADIKYGNNEADRMIIPTYGIRPMIVDVGRATARIKTNPMGLDDTSLLLMEFTERVVLRGCTDEGYVTRTPRDEILQWALRYYAQLQDILAERAADKDATGGGEQALGSPEDRIGGASSNVDIAAQKEASKDCCDQTHSGEDADTDTESASASDRSYSQQPRTHTFDISNMDSVLASAELSVDVKADSACHCIVC